MKRIVILISLIFLVCPVYSQKNIGIMAGSSFSNRIISNVSDILSPIVTTDTRIYSSFYIGGYADIPLSDRFLVSPELYYVRRGTSIYYNPLNLKLTSVYNDLALPVLLKLNIIKQLQLYTGPELSYNIWCDNNKSGSYHKRSDYEKYTDLAITVGTSVRITNNVLLDIRYNHGLINQTKHYNIPGEAISGAYAGHQIPVDYVTKIRSLQLGLKYNFFRKNN